MLLAIVLSGKSSILVIGTFLTVVTAVSLPAVGWVPVRLRDVVMSHWCYVSVTDTGLRVRYFCGLACDPVGVNPAGINTPSQYLLSGKGLISARGI